MLGFSICGKIFLIRVLMKSFQVNRALDCTPVNRQWLLKVNGPSSDSCWLKGGQDLICMRNSSWVQRSQVYWVIT